MASRTDDDLAHALDISLAVADRTHRASARTNLDLEQARAQVREMEARRLAAKYGKDGEAAAQAAIREQAMRLDDAYQASERLRIERVTVAPDRAVLHGRILTGKPGGLDVIAMLVTGKPGAQVRTDDRGYFLLEVPVFEQRQPRTPLPVVESAVAAIATEASVLLVVRRGDRELLHDREPTVLRPGRAVYREVAVTEGEPARTR
jgi:hypothetical protein